MVPNRLTLRSLSATAVAVPMARPLGTSAQRIDIAPLLLIDLDTDEGVSGHAYAFCYLQSIARSLVPVVAELSAALAGLPLVPLDLSHRIARHFRLPGLVGPLAMVASSVDTAIWDALATVADMPLATLLGADPRPIPAYNSNGLGLMSPKPPPTRRRPCSRVASKRSSCGWAVPLSIMISPLSGRCAAVCRSESG